MCVKKITYQTILQNTFISKTACEKILDEVNRFQIEQVPASIRSKFKFSKINIASFPLQR